MESDNQSECEAQRSRGITLEVLLNATKLSVGKHEQLSHSKALSKRGAAIRKIENLHHCPHLKVLYLYDNEIEAVENLDAVPQLTHLHLQGNCLRRIENLEPLKLLEKLYLEKNAISRLEGLAGSFRLQELYLANQNVPIDLHFSFEEETMRALAVWLFFNCCFAWSWCSLSVLSMSAQASLRILDLSHCRVAATKPLTLLRSLEQLDLSKNLIEDLEDVFALVGGITSLVELDLRGNPVTATTKYREKTITFSSAHLGGSNVIFVVVVSQFTCCAALLHTALLDKKDVDPNQRRMMQSHLAHKYR